MPIVKVLLLSVAILAIAFLGFALQILFKKNGKFPNTHVSGNTYLKSKGVRCIQSDDKNEQTKAKKEQRFKNLSLNRPAK